MTAESFLLFFNVNSSEHYRAEWVKKIKMMINISVIKNVLEKLSSNLIKNFVKYET